MSGSNGVAISLVILAACQGTVLSAQPSNPIATRPRPSAQASVAKAPAWTAEDSALQSGELYEVLRDYSKAEEQFLAAAKSTDFALRARAFEGLKRVAEHAQQFRESRALFVADEYARQEEWERARDAYGDVANTASEASLTRAIDGMRRMHERLRWENRAATFDTTALWLGRVAAVGLVVWWLGRLGRSIRNARRSIRVFPFIGQQDETAQEILFWFAYVRAKWRAAAPTPGAVLMVSYTLPYVDLPGLPSDVPEIGELTVGETTLPLKDLLSTWGRPLVRVSGGWTTGTPSGRVYAEIERRRRWHGYIVRTSVGRSVTPGAAQASDLELFSYDVLIRAVQAHAE
jgi:hypothetical protein